MTRFLLVVPLCVAELLAQQGSAAPPTRWQRAAAPKQELLKEIVPLSHEPLDFLLRRGDHFDDEASRYQRMYDPENLKRMADAGVRWGRLYFYKGFGLEYERENMRKDVQAAARMHQLGMKVALYMGGTMFTETLYHELPEARNWEARDQDNKWVPYGMQTYRHYACPNEPAYREYLKRILKIGIEEVHADEIDFDNVMLQAEPKSCRCPRCMRAFHDFLRKAYPTREAALSRFGIPEVDWIVPNEWDSSASPESITAINDPVLQEWVRFRCESLARYANALYDYVKSLNRDVAVHFNIKGVYSFNRYWTNAVYHPLFAGRADVVSFDTGGYDARIDKSTGALVTQIRSYKMARNLGAGCEESLVDELRSAVHMAFGFQPDVKGYAGAPFYAFNTSTPFLEFFRFYNQRYYTGTREVHDVAVLRNWPSMAYSINATYVPATLMEQVLIQHRVPFDLLFDEQLKQLNRYQAVILAGQESVSDVQVRQLLEYVRGGGTLVVAGNTGQYNERRERRRTNPLLPARNEGHGRVIVVPQIVRADSRAPRTAADANQDPEPGAPSRRGAERMSPAQWVLPKNHEEIYSAIVGGLPRGLSLKADVPLTTIAELLTRPESRETIAHFINFESKPLGGFDALVRKQFAGPVKSVECFTPDADDPVKLPFDEAGDRVKVKVPVLRRYAMIVIAQ